MKYLLLFVPFALAFSCSPVPGTAIDKAVIADSVRAFVSRHARGQHSSIDTFSVMSAENISAQAVIGLQIEYAKYFIEIDQKSFVEDSLTADSLKSVLAKIPMSTPNWQREQIYSDFKSAVRSYQVDSSFRNRGGIFIDSLKKALPLADSASKRFMLMRTYYVCSYDDIIVHTRRRSDTAIIRCSFDEHYKMWSFVYDMKSHYSYQRGEFQSSHSPSH